MCIRDRGDRAHLVFSTSPRDPDDPDGNHDHHGTERPHTHTQLRDRHDPKIAAIRIDSTFDHHESSHTIPLRYTHNHDGGVRMKRVCLLYTSPSPRDS